MADQIFFDGSRPGRLLIKLSGEWQMSSRTPSIDTVVLQLDQHKDIQEAAFDVSGVKKWDSALIAFVLEAAKLCRKKDIRVAQDGLPEGVRKFLDLASRTKEKVAAPEPEPLSFLERIGDQAVRVKNGMFVLIDFLGELAVAFGRLAGGKSFFRRDDFVMIVQRCGVHALGLVSLISVLVGVILAFIGVIQLEMFGAQIFIADIVGIAMVRVMGAIMTGIIMSGRTGASFAAELGIMQTNEEIDALRTLGVSPIEFLVMPRVLAMVIMMPLLTLYANLMGIAGGFMISASVLGINPVEYLHHTQAAVNLSNLWIGLAHSVVFGVIIAVSGCLRGMQCERSAAGVGEATTSAVVTAVTAIVVATAVITFVCQMLGV
ncbi:MAG: ABC transporter permease [Candidatus Omnitrophica bacterium]|nr:ABC transporter permease [Candidatus Omnitrophota bacterium]